MNAIETIDPRAFRDALGNFATGVTVITTHCEKVGKVGMTANSFNSVSLNPPMVLWSLARHSKALEFFRSAGKFCVNVLAADQVSLSDHFASKKTDKFADVKWRNGALGLPVLEGTAATFECETAFEYEGGDHMIFVGTVHKFTDSQRKALLYHGGKYAVSNLHPVNALAGQPSAPQSTGFVEEYLDYLLAKAADNFERGFQKHLDKRGVAKYEWRILVTINDFQEITGEQLAEIVLLEGDQLRQTLAQMHERGLVERPPENADRYRLARRGEDEVTHLLAAAKAHEMDTMGSYTAEESMVLKSLLKRLV